MNVVYFLDSHCHFGNPWRNCSSGTCYRRIYLQSQSSIYALQVRRNATFKASQWGLIRRDAQEKNSGVINSKAILRFIAYEHLFRTPPPLIERKSKKSIITISHYTSIQQPGCRNEKIFLGDCHVPIFYPSNESNPYEVHLHTTRNEMTRVRDREIKEIVNFTPRTDSVNLVVVAVDCNVGHCLPISYSRLCQHKKTLTVQEGGRLGIETVCLLYRARQKVQEIWRCKSMTLQSHSSENWSTRPSMGCSSQGRRCPSWSPRWIRHIQNSGRDRFESRTCLNWGETRLWQYRR